MKMKGNFEEDSADSDSLVDTESESEKSSIDEAKSDEESPAAPVNA